MTASSDLRRVCLVTAELYPFTAGGIGRLTHNIIVDSHRRKAPVEFHLLVPCWSDLDERTVVASFGGKVRFHRAQSLDTPGHKKRWGTLYPPRWAFTDTPFHADSLELMLELKRLELDEGLHFDTVEFPDYLGWAFCTLQERRLGLAFASTQVAVRLHSTDGLLQARENQQPNATSLATLELERRALQEADLVVAHLESIVRENERFYGFSPEWRRKVTVNFPPIDGAPTAGDSSPRVAAVRDLVFVTKVQRVKRPELFVAGAVAFMTRNPAYKGRAIFACHVGSNEYANSIRDLVPPALLKRFLFVGPEAREALMRSGVVVIPSEYESLNLAAYEAASLGATIVLNDRCPAFQDGTPFVDGENCHKFDGTVDGLADVLERAVRTKPPKKVTWKAEEPYFTRKPDVWRPRPSAVGRGKVSVLITNFNLGAYLPHAIESIAASTYDNVEIVVVDDASTNPLDAEVLARLERDGVGLPVKVVRNVVNRGLPASRNAGLARCTGDYVMPLDADDRIAPRFIETAVRALESSPEYGVVVPTTGYFLTDRAAEDREFVDYACFLGDTPTLGLIANRLSTATSVMRRSLFEQFQYDEKLDSYEDWSLYLRLTLAGVRFLVTNEIGFHYRRRERSMVRGIGPDRHQRLLARIYSTLPSPLPPTVQLRNLTTLASTQVVTAPTPEPRRPLGYRVIDRANTFVKRSPAVHRSIKMLLPTPAPEKPLRYELVDRLSHAVRRVTPRLGR